MIKMGELLKCIESKKVFIQTHNYPDPDAIASAYGMKKLLQMFGIEAVICYRGRIDRYSLKSFIEYLDTDVINVDDVDLLGSGEKVILVDSQKGNANITDLVSDDVICIDHHPTYEKVEYCLSDIREEVGACASIVAEYFVRTETEIDEATATALLYGIKVDTANLSRGVSKLDLDMFYMLYWKANMKVLARIERSEVQANDLRAYANAIRSIKIKENVSFAHTGGDCPEQLIASISDFMLELSEVDCSIVYSIRQDGIKLSVRSCVPYIDSGKLTNVALKGIGSGGGHQSMAGGFVPYPNDMEDVWMLVYFIENRFMEEVDKMDSE